MAGLEARELATPLVSFQPAGASPQQQVLLDGCMPVEAPTIKVSPGAWLGDRNPKGSKYHYSSYLVAIWAPKIHTILALGPFGNAP